MSKIEIQSPLVIPFGTDRITPRQIVLVDGMLECRLPHVIIRRDRDEPLRLNSDGWDFAEPPPLSKMPEIAHQLGFLCTHLKRYCGIHDKLAKLFLEKYFAFVALHIMEHQNNLTASLARFGSLYRYEDWAFSALKPLPRAHVFAPDDTGAAPYDPAAMLRVDFAFWTGAEIVSIELVGGETRGARDAKRRERLSRAGIRILGIHHQALENTSIPSLLPEEFHWFWEKQALPSGPFMTGFSADPIGD